MILKQINVMFLKTINNLKMNSGFVINVASIFIFQIKQDESRKTG